VVKSPARRLDPGRGRPGRRAPRVRPSDRGCSGRRLLGDGATRMVGFTVVLLRGSFHGAHRSLALLFALVVLGHHRRRVLHFNVTEHPPPNGRPSRSWTPSRKRLRRPISSAIATKSTATPSGNARRGCGFSKCSRPHLTRRLFGQILGAHRRATRVAPHLIERRTHAAKGDKRRVSNGPGVSLGGRSEVAKPRSTRGQQGSLLGEGPSCHLFRMVEMAGRRARSLLSSIGARSR
jgi:hypothetical protein